MTGWAALVAKDAAVASGLGSSVLGGIAPSAIDGFAVGTLLCGLCLVLVMAPRRLSRRRKRSTRQSVWTTGPHNPMTPDLSSYATAYARAATTPIADPFADESAEIVVYLPAREENPPLRDPKNTGKHRPAGPDLAEKRPELRRSPGRHAAPPVGVGSRVASKLTLSSLALRD